MRSSLPAALVSLLLPSLAVATAARSACLHLRSSDLAAAAACGNKILLQNCLADASGEASPEAIEACFVRAGCTPRGAEFEANWVVQFCDGEADELKRRRPEPIPGPTPEPVPVPFPFPQAATTTAAAQSSSLVCSTQSMTEIQTCASTNRYECSATSVPIMVCAAGLLCLRDKAGNALCMKRDDNLTTSGAVVAIFMAVVMTLTVSAIVFLCCRDRRAVKAARAKAEALAIAKANATETQPLVSQPYPGPGGLDPFADHHQAPQH